MYVGTYLDYKNQILWVSERIGGKRLINNHPLILEYYVHDDSGSYTGYDGKLLKKIKLKYIGDIKEEKERCKQEGIKTYELDFNLTNKVLYKLYKGCETPNVHKSYIDIEVDRKGKEYLTVKELVEKGCCPINAVSIYNDWQDTLFTLMLCPENIKFEEAKAICSKFENTVLFDNEKDLLNGIMTVLEDSDVVAGWNSTFFDYPYITKRIINVLGEKATERLCLFGATPKYKEKLGNFGEKNITYDFPGKWFTDYMDLYKKHERGKKESYKLDSIAELELGENKVQHDESLEDMYRQRYEDFIKYNRQDTMLVKKLEDKLKYIDIHNAQAHEILCPMEQTMGTVAWVDQSIINEAHDKGLIIADRVEDKNKEFDGIVAPGAFVPTPVTGLCQYIMSYDMNSLYPTTCRALNMSPESIYGQVRLTMTIPYLRKKIEDNNYWKNVSKKLPDWGAAWGDEFGTLEYKEVLNRTDTPLIVDVENGGSINITAKELYDIIFNENSNLCISGFGTIFRTDKMSLINSIFTRWYTMRKKYKKEMAKYEDMAVGVKIEDEELLKQLMEQ